MHPAHRERTRGDVGQPYRLEENRDTTVRLLAATAVGKDGRVLVMREEDEPYRKSWVVPQGHPRPGETLREAAAREVGEELGLDVEIERLLGVYEDFTGGPTGPKVHWVIVPFLAHAVNGSVPRPSREAIDFAWIDPTSKAPDSPQVNQSILTDVSDARTTSRR